MDHLTDGAGEGGAGARTTLAALLADPRFEVAPTADVLDIASDLPAGATVTVTTTPRRGVAATVAAPRRRFAHGMQPAECASRP